MIQTIRYSLALAVFALHTAQSLATYTVTFSQGALGGSSSTLTAASPATPAPGFANTITNNPVTTFTIGTGTLTPGYTFNGPATTTSVILNVGFESTLDFINIGTEDAFMVMNNVQISNLSTPVNLTIHLSESGYAGLPTGNYDLTNQLTVQNSFWNASRVVMSSSFSAFPAPGMGLAVVDPTIPNTLPKSVSGTATAVGALAHITGNPFTVYTTIFIENFSGVMNFGNIPNSFTRLRNGGPLSTVVPAPSAFLLIASSLPVLAYIRRRRNSHAASIAA